MRASIVWLVLAATVAGCAHRLVTQDGLSYVQRRDRLQALESWDMRGRIATVERWQQETEKDRYFALDVPWLKTKRNLAEIVERVFRIRSIEEDRVQNADQLARIIINNHKK